MKSYNLNFILGAGCMTAFTMFAHADTALASTTATSSKKNMQMTNQGSSSSQKMGDVQPSNDPTPPAMINLKYGAEPYISVDYLYWTARQDNMEYAYPVKIENQNDDVSKGKVHYPDFEFDSGFRVGAGLDFKHDGWDTYLNYTWFHPDRAHDSTSTTLPELLYSAWTANNTFEFINEPTFISASESWKFKNDSIDWELGRNFFVSRYLTFRPFAGLKTAWQKQKQRIAFSETPSNRLFTLNNKQNFWGIGIRVGIDSAWYVYKKNLSIIADFALSGLWSNIKVKQNNLILLANGTLFKTFQSKESYHSIKPVLEWSLGMQWESWLYENAMKISLRAAWEEQLWFDQNNLQEGINGRNGNYFSYKARGGNLTMEGLTLRARFDF